MDCWRLEIIPEPVPQLGIHFQTLAVSKHVFAFLSRPLSVSPAGHATTMLELQFMLGS